MITVKLSVLNDSQPERQTEITIHDTPDQGQSMAVIAAHVVAFWAAMVGDDPEVLRAMTNTVRTSMDQLAGAVTANPVPK